MSATERMNWLDRLASIETAELPDIAKEFGEYASLLGFDTAFFLHEGDLRITESAPAIEALLHKAGDLAPFLIVRRPEYRRYFRHRAAHHGARCDW